MNTGIISSRYARALLKFVEQTGNGAQVYAQAVRLLENPEDAPERLEPELEALTSLLVKNGRVEYVRLVLNSFVRLYRNANGIKYARLRVAGENPGLEERLCEAIGQKSGCKVTMDTVRDDSLIGGFILEIDDSRMDASVRGELDQIRRALIDKSNRLV